MPGRETKKPIKKTVVKKTVAKKTVTKQSKVTLDNFPFDELLKICKKDKELQIKCNN